MTAASCNSDVDEFKFTGRVVGARMCSSSQLGYIIDIITPDSIGKSVTIDGIQYKNAVIGYRASRMLYSDDTIVAVGYVTKSYSNLNCMGDISLGLPEVVLLSVDEDR